jgi:hypothetical protein
MQGSRSIGALVLSVFVATACAKVLGIKDAELEPTTCGYSTSDSCLQSCINSSCCSETTACMNDSECSGLVSCIAGCDSADDTCQSACYDSYLSALGNYVSMTACLSVCDCGVGGAGGIAQVLGDALTQFSKADCNRFNACAPGWSMLAYGSVAECVARDLLQYQWVMSLPGVGWKPTNFIACGNAWAAASCADYMNSVPQAACIVAGTFAAGEPCNSSYQCASLFCDSDGISCGECVAAPTEGEDCVTGGCAGGLTCSTNDVCRKPRGLGESCGDDYPCQTQLDCYAGLCKAPIRTTGTACDTDVNLNCDMGLNYVCALTTQKCVPVTQYASDGQDCGVVTSSASATLCSRGTCDDTQTCVSRAADGETCDDSLGPYCEWPAFCSYGICQLESDLATCK